MTWRLEQTIGPYVEPVELEFVRDQHLRVLNGNAEDDFIERLIRATRRQGEKVTRRAWVRQTFELIGDAFPIEPCLYLPRPPLQAIESIEYLDGDGALQTMDPADYRVTPLGVTSNHRGRVALAYGKVWPTTRREPDAVVITFRAGYPDLGSPALPEVPEDLIHGMLLMIGELYKVRSESIHAFNQNDAVIRSSQGLNALWMKYRVGW